MGKIGILSFSLVALAFRNGLDFSTPISKDSSAMIWLHRVKMVNFGLVTPAFKRVKGVPPPRRSAVWLRSLGGATARPCRDQHWVSWDCPGSE